VAIELFVDLLVTEKIVVNDYLEDARILTSKESIGKIILELKAPRRWRLIISAK